MSIAQGDTLNIASSDSSIACKSEGGAQMLMWGWGQTAGLLDRRSPGLVKASPSRVRHPLSRNPWPFLSLLFSR
jgi:hypothetical protein